VFEAHALRERFEREMRPYILNEERDARTLLLWIDEYFGPRDGA
jgi:hypothetical protein